jgi:cell division protein FtsB
MKILFAFLAIAFVVLQAQLWVGDGSVHSLSDLEVELAAQRAINAELEQRNKLLEVEVVDLKNGLEAVEERARSELGMIAEGETFYLIIE